jgi:large subunit ribosomal protein L29e
MRNDREETTIFATDPMLFFTFDKYTHNIFFSILQQKNTCAHNNTHKAHANGIKKKKRTKYVSSKGMDPKFLRNQRFCKKYNKGGRAAAEE